MLNRIMEPCSFILHRAINMTLQVAPFGGVKQSGLGREGSKYGMDDYLEVRLILCLLFSFSGLSRLYNTNPIASVFFYNNISQQRASFQLFFNSKFSVNIFGFKLQDSELYPLIEDITSY